MIRVESLKWKVESLMLCALLLIGCNEPLPQTPDGVLVRLPERCIGIVSPRLELKDRNMGYTYVSETGSLINDSTVQMEMDIPIGYYDCSFEAQLQISEHYAYPVRLFSNLTVADDRLIEMDAFAVNTKRDFVLAELFVSGTQTPEGKQYTGDKYFRLVNNSDETLYADGLVLLESKFKNSKKYEVTPDKMSEAFSVDALYRVPGDGTRFPVAPGASFIIADNALDHRPYNANSFDMSHADVEWYDVSTSAQVTDVDNPAVPNLDKIYCYTLSIWVPNNQGTTSFAIGRIPDTIPTTQYLAQYGYNYTYINVTQAGTFEMSGNAYLFPNEWIIDAVNLCPQSVYEWLVVHPSLDCGFAYVAQAGNEKTRYGKCMKRKRNEDGTLIDTNNSSSDFEMAQPAGTCF